jgi:hypothetical protein
MTSISRCRFYGCSILPRHICIMFKMNRALFLTQTLFLNLVQRKYDFWRKSFYVYVG